MQSWSKRSRGKQESLCLKLSCLSLKDRVMLFNLDHFGVDMLLLLLSTENNKNVFYNQLSIAYRIIMGIVSLCIDVKA